jgi:hypothetical protein
VPVDVLGDRRDSVAANCRTVSRVMAASSSSGLLLTPRVSS